MKITDEIKSINDVIPWLIEYKKEAMKLKAHYPASEVIGWIINDIKKSLDGK